MARPDDLLSQDDQESATDALITLALERHGYNLVGAAGLLTTALIKMLIVEGPLSFDEVVGCMRRAYETTYGKITKGDAE